MNNDDNERGRNSYTLPSHSHTSTALHHVQNSYFNVQPSSGAEQPFHMFTCGIYVDAPKPLRHGIAHAEHVCTYFYYIIYKDIKYERVHTYRYDKQGVIIILAKLRDL